MTPVSKIHIPLYSRDKPAYSYNDIFQFIVDYKRQHDGNSPSYRQIGEKFKINTSHVKYILTRLCEAGKIYFDSGDNAVLARNICVIGSRWIYDG